MDDFRGDLNRRLSFGDAIAALIGLIPAVVISVVMKKFVVYPLAVALPVATIWGWRSTRFGAAEREERAFRKVSAGRQLLGMLVMIVFGFLGSAAAMAIDAALSVKDPWVLLGGVGGALFCGWMFRMGFRMG